MMLLILFTFYFYLLRNRSSPREFCKKIQFDGIIVKIFLKKVSLFQDFMMSTRHI